MNLSDVVKIAKHDIRQAFEQEEKEFTSLRFTGWTNLATIASSDQCNIYKPGVYLYCYNPGRIPIEEKNPWLYADYIGMSTNKIDSRRRQFITVLQGRNVFENSRQDHIGAEKAKKIWPNISYVDFSYNFANCPSKYSHEVEQILLDSYYAEHKSVPKLQGQWSKKYDFKKFNHSNDSYNRG